MNLEQEVTINANNGRFELDHSKESAQVTVIRECVRMARWVQNNPLKLTNQTEKKYIQFLDSNRDQIGVALQNGDLYHDAITALTAFAGTLPIFPLSQKGCQLITDNLPHLQSNIDLESEDSSEEDEDATLDSFRAISMVARNSLDAQGKNQALDILSKNQGKIIYKAAHSQYGVDYMRLLYPILDNLVGEDRVELATDIGIRTSLMAVNPKSRETAFEIVQDLLEQVSPSNRSLGLSIVRSLSKSLDLNPNISSRLWWNSAGRNYSAYRLTTKYNLERMFELAEAEGYRGDTIQKLAREQGIYNFGRFSYELLMDQTKEVEPDMKYGILLVGNDDHNITYWSRNEIWDNLNEQLKGKFRLVVLETDTLGKGKRVLTQTYRRFQERKASFFIAAMHGNKNEVVSGPDAYRIDKLTRNDLQNRSKFMSIGEILEPGAPIILDSCETCMKDGIGQTASEQFHTTVYGSASESNLTRLNFLGVKEGVPEFDVGFSGGPTRVFYDGKLIKKLPKYPVVS